MNKWFAGLMVCGLAFGMAACSDDDGNNGGGGCTTPALVTVSAKFDAAVKNGLSSTTSPLSTADCEKYAENLANYLASEENNAELKSAFTTIPDFKANSVLSWLCAGIGATQIIIAARTMKADDELGKECVTNDTNNSSWHNDLDSNLGKLNTVEGWNAVLTTAAEATDTEKNNGN